MSKTIICRCEDITENEIKGAIAQGHHHIESLKRFLAIGTGPCQAKNCLVLLTRIMIEEGILSPEQASPIVSRPPLGMTPLKYYAGTIEEED